jgi:hypothetical protein
MNYLEVSSSNRDRNKFPYPSDFDVVLGTPNSLLDPIITGGIYFIWGGITKVDPTLQQQIISTGPVLKNINPNGIVINQARTNVLNTQPFGYYPGGTEIATQEQNLLNTDPLYYNGYRILLRYRGAAIIGTSRIIESYNPEQATIFVIPSIPEIVDPIDAKYTYTIYDPSSNSQIHVPLFDSLQRKALSYLQAYSSYYIINETISYNTNIIYRKISDYDFNLRIANLETPFPDISLSSNIFSLVKTVPRYKYMIEAVDPYTHQITLPSYLNYGTGYFVGQYVYNTGLIGTGPSSSGISYQTIDSTGSTNANTAYYILDYSGAPSNILTVSPNTTNGKQNLLPTINNYGIPGLNDIITIGTLVRDNFYPLQYSGTVVSQNEAVAYEVTLTQLCLPNVTLTTGSRIAQYPYVYVELRPLGSPSAVGKNVIYSNNPNATNALFTVAINDVVNPLTSVFVRVYSSQVQTIKIKPNDSFHFSVYLPNGKLFLPYGLENNEFYSPLAPNPFFQIEAVFGLRRL